MLVACPTYDGLRDCLDAYLEAYEAFRWHKRELLLVDNTRDGGKYAESLRARGLNVIRVEPTRSFQETFALCWEEILKYAVKKDVHWVFSLEQDVICPPLTLDTLLNIASYCNAPFVTHCYPYHWGANGIYQGLGCTLILREVLAKAMEKNRNGGLVEGSIYEVAKALNHVSLSSMLEIKHMDGERRHWQFDVENDPRVLYPPEYLAIEEFERKAEAAIAKLKAKVSVVIPCYNQARFLGDAIQSALDQKHPVDEILVHNDGSTDNFAEVVARFNDKRIKVSAWKKNRGCVAATNHVFSRSKGTHTVVLPADDMLSSSYVKCALYEFTQDPELEFCTTMVRFIDEAGKSHNDPENPIRKAEMVRKRTRDEWMERLYHGGIVLGAGTFLTKAWREIGGMKEEWSVISDYELWLQFLKRHNIQVIERELCFYRLHPAQRTHLTPETGAECARLYEKARSMFWQKRAA